MRTLRHALPGNFPAQCFALILASALVPGHPASGASRSDEILDPSSGVRIYRGVSRYGLPVVVLTNLDEAGNRLPSLGGAAGGAPASGRAASPCDGEDKAQGKPESADANRASGTPASPPVASVKVVVNQGEGTGEVDARDVEVTADGSGGTTVIININPPISPERETVIVPTPFAFPVVAVGGLAGGYRYPDHLPFLGYGHDNSSPSWFGGLVLNAGNGFGLKNGTPCGRGYDCMFGPPGPHP